MQFEENILSEITGRIGQLGLTNCPICDGESLYVDRRPSLLHIGGLDAERDAESNVLSMVRIFCNLCGYTMLFDSERHHGPDEPALRLGRTPST